MIFKLLSKVLKGRRAPQPREVRNLNNRLQKRNVHCLSVYSPGLPNRRALTVDLGPAGMCIETFSPLHCGKKLELELDTGAFPLHFQGHTVWCKEMSRGIFRTGITLEDSPKHALHALKRYVQQEDDLSASLELEKAI